MNGSKTAEYFEAFVKNSNQKKVTGRALLKFLQEYLGYKEVCSIIDLGSGGGYIIPYIAKLSDKNCGRIEYSAVDIERKFIQETEKKIDSYNLTKKEIIWGDIFSDEINLLPNNADIIFVSHVLYYSEDVEKFIHAIVEKMGQATLLISIHENRLSDINFLRRKYGTIKEIDVVDKLKTSVEQKQLLESEVFLASKLRFPVIDDTVICDIEDWQQESEEAFLHNFILQEDLDEVQPLSFYEYEREAEGLLLKQNGQLVIWSSVQIIYLASSSFVLEEHIKFLLNYKDEKGWSALHWSVYTHKIEITKELLHRGVDIEKGDIDQFTAFDLAVSKGLTEEVSLFIDSGALAYINPKTLSIAVAIACAMGRMEQILTFTDIFQHISYDLDQKDFYVWTKKAADAGYVPSVNDLGIMYYKGDYVEQSYPKAVELYKKSAKYEYGPSFLNMAIIYKHGIGVFTSPEKARDYYEKALYKDYQYFQYGYGSIYRVKYAEGNKLEYVFEYLTVQSENGDNVARYLLSFFYRYGELVEKDLNKVIELLEEAKQEDLPFVYHNLGAVYREVGNDEQSIYYYRKAASINFPLSIFNLGVNELSQKSLDFNMSEVIKYFSRLDRETDASTEFCFGVYEKAQYNLGLIYLYNYDNGDHFVNPVVVFERSANKNFELAEYALSLIYFCGVFVEKDYKKARFWYKRAKKHDERGVVKLLSCEDLPMLEFEMEQISDAGLPKRERWEWWKKLAIHSSIEEMRDHLSGTLNEYSTEEL